MNLAKRDPRWKDLKPIDGRKAVTRFSGPRGKKRRREFLELLAQTGLWAHSARAVGVDPDTPRRLAKKDKDFELACAAAREHYADTVREAVHERAVDGYEEPIVYQGKIQTDEEGKPLTVTKKSDRLLELLAKAKCPEFREKVDVDANIRGGVLVVGVQARSEEEWAERHGGPRKVVENQAPAPPPADQVDPADPSRTTVQDPAE